MGGQNGAVFWLLPKQTSQTEQSCVCRYPHPVGIQTPHQNKPPQRSLHRTPPRQQMSSSPQATGEEREPGWDHQSEGQPPHPTALPPLLTLGARRKGLYHLPCPGWAGSEHHPPGCSTAPKGQRSCTQLTRAPEGPLSPEPLGPATPSGAQMRHLGAQSLCLSQLRTDAFVTAQSMALYVASPSPLRAASPLGCMASVVGPVGLCQLPVAWS